MADQTWQNREYGTLEGGGKERVIDYAGNEDYFAPVRAALIINEDGVVLGKRDSPFFITGDVQLRDEAGNILGDRDSPVFTTGNVLIRDEEGQVLGSPFVVTGDVTIRDEDGYFLGSGDHPVHITGMVSDAWVAATVKDEAMSDNDKSLIVPTNYEWNLAFSYVTFVTAAAEGNRQLAMQVIDTDGTVVGETVAGLVQTASVTGYYQFGPALADLTAFRDVNYLMTPIPPDILLNPTEQLRFFDRNNVSATDSVIVTTRVKRRQKPYFSG